MYLEIIVFICLIIAIIFIVIKRGTFPKSLKKATFDKHQLMQQGGSWAHKGCPQNSMTLYNHAIDEWGFKMIECDVRMTKDGIFVLSHENIVKASTCDASGNDAIDIEESCYNTLKDLRIYIEHWNGDPYPITTLSTILSKCKQSDVILMIDMKCTTKTEILCTRLYDLIKEHQMLNKVILEPYDEKAISYFMKLDKEHLLSYQLENSFSIHSVDNIIELGFLDKCNRIIISKLSDCMPTFNDLRIIRYAHRQGLLTKVVPMYRYNRARRWFLIGVDIVSSPKLTY